MDTSRQPVVALKSWRRIARTGGLFIALVAALAAYDVVRSRRDAVERTGRDLSASAIVIAEQAARSLQTVDIILQHIAADSRSGWIATQSAGDLRDYLANQAVGVLQMDRIVLLDASGKEWASSDAAGPGDAALVPWAAPVFEALRDHPDAGLAVGAARRVEDGTKLWVFPMARRMETASERFAGVVMALGRVEYYQQFYRDVHLAAGTEVSLVRRDGSLLAREPAAPASLGRRFALVERLIAANRTGDSEPLRLTSPIDGVARFGALAAVTGYPLFVGVTRDVGVALEPWRRQAIGSALRTLALVVLAAALLALLRRQFLHLDQARLSLEDSRERFALAAAGSDVGIWSWRKADDMVFASPRALEIFGLGPGAESLPRDQWFRAVQIHPDDATAHRQAIDAHFAGRTPAYFGQYRVCHPGGAYRWIRVRGLCVRDAAGAPLHMAGSVADIDAEQRATVALRLSEQRFALAVAGSDDGIWDFDYVADQAFASSRARRILGLPLQPEVQPLDEWLASLPIHPDDRPRRQTAIDAHLSGDTPAYQCEYRITDAEGATRWVRVRGVCVRDADGKPQRMAGSVADIDAQKRAEEALRQSEERYQLAVAGSNEGLWDWDLPTDQLFLSARAQKLLWLEASEPLRPRRYWNNRTHYHPDDVGRVRAAISAHLRRRSEHFMVEYRLRHHSGEWRWYLQRGIAVRDEQGRPTRMAGSMEDITDRKNAEVDRERLEAQLLQARKLEAIGTLAGGIAHDFNNILAAILGYGELAQKESGENSALRRHIDAAISAAMRAKSLVERILAFSRSGMGERVAIQAQSVVAEALDAVAASLPPGVRLERRLDAGDAAVLGDPTQVHQVVMNLCTNASQAMRSRGTLTVTLDQVEHEAPMCASCKLLPGRYLRLAVGDTGVGIAAAILGRIFDPFFTTQAIGVGTGLGLSLVHGIVTDLGGGIEVDSRVGEGSTFTVYLPLHHGDAPALAMDVPARTASGHGETVLLIDDEETLVRLGEEMIASLGYEPVGFTSGRRALETFGADPGRFDVVLSDEAMPEMTGTDLARAIHRIRPEIPIVLMSGYVTPALSARSRDVGVTEILSKPLLSDDISLSLANALHR